MAYIENREVRGGLIRQGEVVLVRGGLIRQVSL